VGRTWRWRLFWICQAGFFEIVFLRPAAFAVLADSLLTPIVARALLVRRDEGDMLLVWLWSLRVKPLAMSPSPSFFWVAVHMSVSCVTEAERSR